MDETHVRIQEELDRKRGILRRELRDRSLWFVRLRWWVPPCIVAGSATARWIGVSFPGVQVLSVAAFILAYNTVFHLLGRPFREDPPLNEPRLSRFATWQVVLDYTAMFLLIHFTGGAASPFIFFFIFHIIFTSILLRPRSAYGFSLLVVAGMCLLAAAEYRGWVPNYSLVFRGTRIDLAQEPFHLMVELGFFAASVLITAFSTTAIMTVLRTRILELGTLTRAVNDLNKKLQALYSVIQAIGSAQQLDQVLDTVTSELKLVMNVRGISIKLLSEDGKHLRYAAAYGLPGELFKGREVEVAKSPLNRRILEGEPYMTGDITEREQFQFGEALAAAQVHSVLFVPLNVEGRVIGILGAYCVRQDRFDPDEVAFFRLAAGLVAMALENARAYEAVERLMEERSWYMMRVTHNLRAPLSAMLSVLQTVRGGYLGALTDPQQEYLRRLDRRGHAMLSMINELMTLAESRAAQSGFARALVDLRQVAGRVRRTFENAAAEKQIAYRVTVPDELPPVRGDEKMLEQLLENLVSNAIKYTPAGGRVDVTLARAHRTVRLEVSDSGIGIPAAEKPSLFREFFRAENARAVEAVGTGLGLAIVKEIVDRHAGRIIVESEPGLGTLFVVHLPLPDAPDGDPPAPAAPEEGGDAPGAPGAPAGGREPRAPGGAEPRTGTTKEEGDTRCLRKNRWISPVWTSFSGRTAGRTAP